MPTPLGILTVGAAAVAGTACLLTLDHVPGVHAAPSHTSFPDAISSARVLTPGIRIDPRLLKPDQTVLLNALRALEIKIQVHQDNLANVLTPGFKRSRVLTRSLGVRTVGVTEGQAPDGSPPPLLPQVGLGTSIGSTTVVFSQGVLEATGRNLDIAIDGNGFLQVQLPDGSTGYTRDGQLQINADGKLVTNQGLVVTPEIALPQDLLLLSIAPSGRVSGRTAGSPDTTTVFGQIDLVKFINPGGLLREANSIYRESPGAGSTVQGSPGDAGFGVLRQAFIERSNVERTVELFALKNTRENYDAIKQVLLGR